MARRSGEGHSFGYIHYMLFLHWDILLRVTLTLGYQKSVCPICSMECSCMKINQELEGICHCEECQLSLVKTWLGKFHFDFFR